METLESITTPAAVVDLDRFQSNTSKMAQRAHDLGVRLRPHVKTHKTLEGIHYQTLGHFGGITVSTLAEAEFYASHGVKDILYAVPVTPNKLTRVMQLTQRIDRLSILLDQLEVVQALRTTCQQVRESIHVMIKVDCGYGRAGLDPEDPQLIKIAQAIVEDPWLSFDGLLTHGGHAYSCTDQEGVRRVALQEVQAVLKAQELLNSLGIVVPTVSIGSTPTCMVYDRLEGITEIRPGNYALFDLFQASIGSCAIDDIALSVVTEIIGLYPNRQTILIDAGALALSKDQGANHLGHPLNFGLVCDLDHQPLVGMTLLGLSQEHGKIKTDETFNFNSLTIGQRVRILPNHSCLVTALHSELYVESNGKLIASWEPVRGW